MSTPIENIVANVNAQTQRDTLQSIGAQQSARRQVADKESAIDAIVDSADQTAKENFFNGIQGDGQAEDLLSSKGSLIDKISENVGVIETLNKSESAIKKILCRREGRDPSNFNTLDDVADDVSLVRDLSVRQTMTEIIQFSAKASSALSANDRATREMMCFPAGLDATTFTDVADVASDQAAMNTISANAQAMRSAAVLPLAMQEIAASQTAMQEVAASQAAMQEVAASQTAMQEVVPSQTARDEVFASQTARDEVYASQTAMQEVAASQAAMQEVAASQALLSSVASFQAARENVGGSSTAVSAIESASSAGNNTIPGPNDASIYIAELKGAGGGGGGNGSFEVGGRGGETSIHRSRAGGGGGGQEDRDGSDGDGRALSPDVLISSSTGGGAAGGSGNIERGGDGGFAKALICNPDQQSLSLTIGNGGNPGDEFGEKGEDGSATIFTPNVLQ